MPHRSPRPPDLSRFCALATLLAAAASGAEPQGEPLDTVVVVGATPYGGMQAIDRLAGSAQAASSKDVDRSHAADLTAFLDRSFGSVYVNENQSNPLQPDVAYRGYVASPLLGTAQGLSVYADGVRLNQPFGDVVSWDLVPRAAIERVELIGGGNPLFGFNTLGGALSLHLKDGFSAPGTEAHAAYGRHGSALLEAQTGGHSGSGWSWYATANRLRDDGWRDASPTDAEQAFARLGWRDERTRLSLSASAATTDLTGNGLQDFRLLQQDYASVYTRPDETHNRAALISLSGEHALSDRVQFSGTAYYRSIRTRAFNGDINPTGLGQAQYQPDATERAALTAARYAGFPLSGESQDDTPFPKWRCIANVLLNEEPNEKCNGLANRSALSQHVFGGSGEIRVVNDIAAHTHRLTLGFAFDESAQHFTQSSSFGYLSPERTVVPVVGPGSLADGTQDSETAFDSRVDLTGRGATRSLYVADAVALTPRVRLNVAARYDTSRIRSADAITPGGGAGSLDGAHTFAHLNPSLGVLVQTTPHVALFASASQSSRAPSAIELGCADPATPCRLPNAMAGDPPLAQVVTRTLEAGAKGQAFDRLRWTATAFRGNSEHDIQFVADDQAGFGYFRNFGSTRRQGLELGADARLEAVTLDLQYTYLDATYRSAETLNGEGNSSADGPAPGFGGTIDIVPGDRIPLVPRHVLKAAAEWMLSPRWSLQADARYTGGSTVRGNENGRHEPDGIYTLGQGSYGGYTVLNFGAEWRPMPALMLYLQVNNALDREYSTSGALGVAPLLPDGRYQARPFAGPVIGGERPLRYSTFLAPGAPRNFVLGVKYRLAAP